MQPLPDCGGRYIADARKLSLGAELADNVLESFKGGDVNNHTGSHINQSCLRSTSIFVCAASTNVAKVSTVLDGTRIRERIDAVGTTQAKLAKAIGVSAQAISKMVTGETAESPKLYQIARFLQTTPEYLTGETDDPSSSSGLKDRQLEWRGPASQPSGDVVELEEFDVSYGLGSSFIHDVPVTGVRRVFSRAWIRQFTQSPLEYLFFATGTGDSMVPTIQDADVVLIDSYDRTPRFADKIWAIEIGGLGSIKRLRPTKDGTGMKLISSNPEVPEDIAYDDEMRIVGRVAAVFRKM